MIRLAVSGVDQPSSEAIFARLRGARRATLDECDAVAIVNSSANSVATAERLLLTGRHVLLSTDAARPPTGND
jgi:hypothetical protein